MSSVTASAKQESPEDEKELRQAIIELLAAFPKKSIYWDIGDQLNLSFNLKPYTHARPVRAAARYISTLNATVAAQEAEIRDLKAKIEGAKKELNSG